MLNVAMFDEVNEGTAIFKYTDNLLVGKEVKFVGMFGFQMILYLYQTKKTEKY